MRNSSGPLPCVMGRDASRSMVQPEAVAVMTSDERRWMTDAASTVYPAVRPAAAPPGKVTTRFVVKTVLDPGAETAAAVGVTLARYDQLPAIRVRVTARPASYWPATHTPHPTPPPPPPPL